MKKIIFLELMMKKYSRVTEIAVVALVLASCMQSKQQKTAPTTKQESKIFPQGNKITNHNFTGTAWLQMLVNKDSIFNISVGNVTFEPGARTNWHYHPGGQILLITNGRGRYQEKGKPVTELHEGDVIKCASNVAHWHGAAPDSELTHIAIGTNSDKGAVVWLQPVTDKEYNEIE